MIEILRLAQEPNIYSAEELKVIFPQTDQVIFKPSKDSSDKADGQEVVEMIEEAEETKQEEEEEEEVEHIRSSGDEEEFKKK